MIGPKAQRQTPLMPADVELSWSDKGHAVAAWANRVLVGFIGPGMRRGYSRHLLAEGPWGAPLDEELFRQLFQPE
jgi:hypothetical protein